MNRRFLALIATTVFCFFILFTLYPTVKTSDKLVYEARREYLPQVFRKKGAFATVLCDESMVESTLVSIYTLQSAFAKNPSSKTDILVLMPQDLQLHDDQIQQFRKLYSNIIRTETGSSCEDTTKQLENLLDYQKIIYFTPDILFDNNVDQLFNFPAGSAINSSLFILEPNSNTHDSRIPLSIVKENLHVLEGPIKPWNFHYYHDTDWKKNYDPALFYKWRRYSNDVRHLINSTSQWENSLRQRTVCDAYINSVSQINAFLIQDQFSVLISTYNPDRIEYLSLLIRHLLESQDVHTVYITWHNPDLKVPPSLYEKIKKEDYSRVQVLTQTFDSLNNRFNPIENLQTEAVYIIDDDIYIDTEDLEFTFKIWRNHKDSVVGHFPRLHTYDNTTHEATYNLIGKAPYSIILTKSMFIRSDYLFSYTCLLEPKLHEYVDYGLNCEDIGFMMMASGISGSPSTFVRTKEPLQDFGLTKGISINNSHMPARSQCVSDFITRFWNEKDPLVLSFDTIQRFEKQVILAGDWEKVEKAIMG